MCFDETIATRLHPRLETATQLETPASLGNRMAMIGATDRWGVSTARARLAGAPRGAERDPALLRTLPRVGGQPSPGAASASGQTELVGAPRAFAPVPANSATPGLERRTGALSVFGRSSGLLQSWERRAARAPRKVLRAPPCPARPSTTCWSKSKPPCMPNVGA
jgi:hypothetical protein